MHKDVIYIDVEDDITAIVGKIKASKQRIVALVPPKRVGSLQSAVNMRLIARAASHAQKRVVLITNDAILSGLAAVAEIPVAKTLQSKPEITDVPAVKVDEDGDIIDGRTLPVGELDKAMAPGRASAVDLPTDDAPAPASTSTPNSGASLKERAAKKLPKVPDFNVFRKKFLLIGGGGLLVLLFLVWAMWFAPRATIFITAKTTTVTVDKAVTLRDDATTDTTTGMLKSLRKEQKSELSVTFAATGKKDVGEKATGTVVISPTSDTISKIVLSDTSVTVPAGTVLTSDSGAKYVTNGSVSFTYENLRSSGGRQAVSVTAEKGGTSYNGATGKVTGLSGFTAQFRSATGGGTDKTITVVSDEDLRKAKARLEDKKDDSLRQKLEQLFTGDMVVLRDSYKEQRSQPTPSVAVGAEAQGEVTLKAQVTATMIAVEKKDVAQFLTSSVQKELDGKKSQKIYKDGADAAKLTQFGQRGGADTVHITANAIVGPTIDEAKVKEHARGKNYGDIQSHIESIEGVESVDTKFWPFWVRTVPGDDKRITVEFKLHDR